MSSSVSPHLPASGAGGLPQPLTFIYKSLPNISLKADIYISEPSEHTPPSPILLYLHSGGWIFGSRKEFSQAYFQEFLRRGFVIVSADYRLLPESDFLTGQLEDIRDIEVWLREDLPQLIRDLHQTKLDPKKIVVLGASAGAHLALLTPKLWKKSPSCIISMYGPTNLLSLAPVRRGGFKDFTLPPMSPQQLKAALIEPPPTETPAPKTPEEFMGPRMLLGLAVIGGNIVGEFLVRNLVDGELPEKGSVHEDAVKEISPYHLAAKLRYPPVFQAIGTEDEAFDTSQVISFDKQLRSTGAQSKMIIVDGLGHSFDMNAELGGEVYKAVIVQAVDFAHECVE